jgi:hypothetical protein
MSENITAPAKQAIGRLEILLQDPVLNDHGCTYLDGFVTQVNHSCEDMILAHFGSSSFLYGMN